MPDASNLHQTPIPAPGPGTGETATAAAAPPDQQQQQEKRQVKHRHSDHHVQSSFASTKSNFLQIQHFFWSKIKIPFI